jgi:hypothetical protein
VCAKKGFYFILCRLGMLCIFSENRLKAPII